MRKLFTLLFAAAPMAATLAQCPSIFNCPQGSPVVCDLSDNDPLLWKAPPYTWSQTIGTSDLYEGVADFSLKALPCPDGGNVSISYVLLLDLDNDNLRETAVSSNALPPPGIVFAENAFNPDYSGGEAVQFDKRPVPDSLKFGFALEQTNSWDTLIARLCWQTGSSFVTPRLPEGRHHIKWRIEQDGVVKYCEHSFRIKDCQSPSLACEPEWTVSLNGTGEASVGLTDLLISAEDNSTPFPLLEFSMRKSGAGTGFPLDSAGNKVVALEYDCEQPDSQIAEVWARDRLGNTSACEILLSVVDDIGVCDKVPLLCSRTFWGADEVVQPVTYKMIWVDTSQQFKIQPLSMQPEGCGMLNFLPPVGSFSLTASCDTNPLNGVSTFDLLQISRHILGVQPFDAPWKWIAADANKSNSITTFDMVEIRKLILGIYNKLPANTSWRFFPSDCVFPANPFSGFCPQEFSFVTTSLEDYPSEILFNAVKTGDVNGSASPVPQDVVSAEPRGLPVFLELPDLELPAGASFDVPVKTGTAAEWSGFQLGIRFDPNVLEADVLANSTLPDFDRDAWAQPEPGTLNFSWIGVQPRLLSPGENLFLLRLTALRPTRLSEVLQIAGHKLAAEVYTPNDGIRPLQVRFGSSLPSVDATDIFPIRPNPTTAGVQIPFQLAQAGVVSVRLTDLTGKVVFQLENILDAGRQIVEIPASAFPALGIFNCHVQAGGKITIQKVARL